MKLQKLMPNFMNGIKVNSDRKGNFSLYFTAHYYCYHPTKVMFYG